MTEPRHLAATVAIVPGAPEEYYKDSLAYARRNMVDKLFEDGLYNSRSYAFEIEEIPPHPMELEAMKHNEYFYMAAHKAPVYKLRLKVWEIQKGRYDHEMHDHGDEPLTAHIPVKSSWIQRQRQKLAWKLYRVIGD